jgi:hypothetical protein
MCFSSNSEIYGSLSVFYGHATRFDITVPSTDRHANKNVTFTLEQAMKAQTDRVEVSLTSAVDGGGW